MGKRSTSASPLRQAITDAIRGVLAAAFSAFCLVILILELATGWSFALACIQSLYQHNEEGGDLILGFYLAGALMHGLFYATNLSGPFLCGPFSGRRQFSRGLCVFRGIMADI